MGGETDVTKSKKDEEDMEKKRDDKRRRKINMHLESKQKERISEKYEERERATRKRKEFIHA